jgi:hypothetical protein
MRRRSFSSHRWKISKQARGATATPNSIQKKKQLDACNNKATQPVSSHTYVFLSPLGNLLPRSTLATCSWNSEAYPSTIRRRRRCRRCQIQLRGRSPLHASRTVERRFARRTISAQFLRKFRTRRRVSSALLSLGTCCISV